MSSAEIVTDQYQRSRTYADTIQTQVTDMMDALAAAPVTVPVIDVTFDTSEIAEPVIPDTGPVPTLTAHTPQAVPLPSEEVPGIDDADAELWRSARDCHWRGADTAYHPGCDPA
jgi:hypothetical protein